MVVSLGLVAEEKTDGALEWSVSPGARLANAAHFQDLFPTLYTKIVQ
jgi:hypothetical protein